MCYVRIVYHGCAISVVQKQRWPPLNADCNCQKVKGPYMRAGRCRQCVAFGHAQHVPDAETVEDQVTSKSKDLDTIEKRLRHEEATHTKTVDYARSSSSSPTFSTGLLKFVNGRAGEEEARYSREPVASRMKRASSRDFGFDKLDWREETEEARCLEVHQRNRKDEEDEVWVNVPERSILEQEQKGEDQSFPKSTRHCSMFNPIYEWASSRR